MGTTTQDLGAGPKATAKVLDFAAGSSDGDGLNRKTVATRKPAEETEDVSSPGEPDFDELTKRFERLKQRRQ